MVYSQMSTHEIGKHIQKVTGVTPVWQKVERDIRTGTDSNRTVIVLAEFAYKKLIELGFDTSRSHTSHSPKVDFAITEFRMNERLKPQYDRGETADWYIRLPDIGAQLTAEYVTGTIGSRLKRLVSVGILPADCYRLSVKYQNREREGKLMNYMIVHFVGEKVNTDTIAVARHLLRDASWPNNEEHHMLIFWLRRVQIYQAPPAPTTTPVEHSTTNEAEQITMTPPPPLSMLKRE